MSPELARAVAATENIVAWQVAVSNGPDGQEARLAILAAALSAAGVPRSDTPTPPQPSTVVTVTFPGRGYAESVSAVLDTARRNGAVSGQVASTDAPGLVLNETYQDGRFVR